MVGWMIVCGLTSASDFLAGNLDPKIVPDNAQCLSNHLCSDV